MASSYYYCPVSPTTASSGDYLVSPAMASSNDYPVVPSRTVSLFERLQDRQESLLGNDDGAFTQTPEEFIGAELLSIIEGDQEAAGETVLGGVEGGAAAEQDATVLAAERTHRHGKAIAVSDYLNRLLSLAPCKSSSAPARKQGRVDCAANTAREEEDCRVVLTTDPRRRYEPAGWSGAGEGERGAGIRVATASGDLDLDVDDVVTCLDLLEKGMKDMSLIKKPGCRAIVDVNAGEIEKTRRASATTTTSSTARTTRLQGSKSEWRRLRASAMSRGARRYR